MVTLLICFNILYKTSVETLFCQFPFFEIWLVINSTFLSYPVTELAGEAKDRELGITVCCSLWESKRGVLFFSFLNSSKLRGVFLFFDSNKRAQEIKRATIKNINNEMKAIFFVPHNTLRLDVFLSEVISFFGRLSLEIESL